MSGLIYQLNVKPDTLGERGLPKLSIEEARLSREGVEGDFNRYRTDKKGGSLDRAVLVMPWEALQVLRQEGWPVKPGDIGENITTEGIPYEALQLEQRYRLGTSAVVQIAEICNPCVNLALLDYVGQDRVTEFMRILKGRRGWYARVLEEGTVRRGDSIEQVL